MRGFPTFVGNKKKKNMGQTVDEFGLVPEDYAYNIEDAFKHSYENYADKDKYVGCCKYHGSGDAIPFGIHGETTVDKELRMTGHEMLTWCVRNVDWFLLKPEVLDRLDSPTYELAKLFDIGISEEENEKDNKEFKVEIKQFHSEKEARLKASGARELAA